MLEHFIDHRREVLRRRTTYDLSKAKDRAHILEGFRIALDNIDAVIAIIRQSPTTEEARARLVDRFKLSEVQANAILDMRLRTLTGLERQKIEDEYTGLIKLIGELEDILRSPRRIAGIVKTEALDLKKRFGDPRVHQARLGRHVPRAESWGARRHRDRQPEEGGRRPQLLHGVDAPAHPFLHEQGPRVPPARL
jgi:DNA gyrase/topoisomerase IV subunit A